MPTKFFTEIYGCQMNVSDTTELENVLVEEGLEKVTDPTECDVVIMNTCAVRQTAEDRALSRLGYYKFLKTQKKLIIIFMGCVAQKEKENIILNYPFVDYVIGPKNRHLIPSILKQHDELTTQDKKKEQYERVFASLTENTREYLPPVPDQRFPYRSFITIINGCSKFCTYCIVPYTRGFEASIPSDIIVEQAKELAKNKVKEIYLLGQNVNSYGIDSGDISFAKLLNKVSQVEGIERIKFVSSHPRDVSDELIDELAVNTKLSKSLHFAMQSGSNEILRRMNRQHTYEHFYKIVERIRASVKGIYLSTDIIVGFPGETLNEFEDTVRALREIHFDHAFIYMYSERSGTAAAKFNDTISLEEKKRRAQYLMDIQHQQSKESLVKLLDRTVDVFVEGKGKKPNQLLGFNEYDVRTIFETTKNLDFYQGKIVKVHVNDLIGHTLVGELVTS